LRLSAVWRQAAIARISPFVRARSPQLPGHRQLAAISRAAVLQIAAVFQIAAVLPLALVWRPAAF
jgi:hypothetical protein